MLVLAKMLRMWLFTVSSEMHSFWAISLLRSPAAASTATSRSRSVSSSISSGCFSSMAKIRLSSALVYWIFKALISRMAFSCFFLMDGSRKSTERYCRKQAKNV